MGFYTSHALIQGPNEYELDALPTEPLGLHCNKIVIYFLSVSSSSSTGLAHTQVGSPVQMHLFYFLWSCVSASSSSAAFRSSLIQSFYLLLGLSLFLFPTSITITLLPTYLFSRPTTLISLLLSLSPVVLPSTCFLLPYSLPCQV